MIEQCLPADEILLHFSSLACHMSGELVLRKVIVGLPAGEILLHFSSLACHMSGELVLRKVTIDC